MTPRHSRTRRSGCSPPSAGTTTPCSRDPVPWILGLELDTGPHAEVSFFDGPDPFPEPLPWDVPGAGLTVVRADALHAVSLNDIERTSGATYALERRLGMPVTSRGVPTMLRLQARLRTIAD